MFPLFQNIFQITWNLLHFLNHRLHNLIHQLVVHVSLDHYLLHVNHHLVTSNLPIEVTHHVCRRLGHRTLSHFQWIILIWMLSQVLIQGEYLLMNRN
jgi:hypothetical protein